MSGEPTTVTGNAHLVTPVVTVQGLSKSFGSKTVLSNVSFDVLPGSVHALLGGNGSGKSTLVKALSGVQPADAGGSVTVGSSSVASQHLTPAWASRCGLRFVHQTPATFPTMTVAENLFMSHRLLSRGGWVSRRRLYTASRRLLDQFQIDVSPRRLMGELRLADQTMVSIARALRSSSQDEHRISTLVLDEPTAALPAEEVAVLLDAVRGVARTGAAIIYISHRIEEVLAVADEVTVLRNGHKVQSASTTGLTDRQLISWIVGKPLGEVFPGSGTAIADPHLVLEMRDVAAGPLREINLSVYGGEILGIAGLLGSGRTELLQAIFGHRPVNRGTVLINGSPVRIDTPGSAMAQGIGYVPESRNTEAAFPDLTVGANICVADIPRHSRFGFRRPGAERADVREALAHYAVRAPSDLAPMSALSGGNQQKVVLARWMRRHPVLLLLDEPTQGVDVGARSDAYHLIRHAVDSGLAVILVSSDFEELAEMSDRVLILNNGRITVEVSGPDLTEHRLTELVLLAREEGRT